MAHRGDGAAAAGLQSPASRYCIRTSLGQPSYLGFPMPAGHSSQDSCRAHTRLAPFPGLRAHACAHECTAMRMHTDMACRARRTDTRRGRCDVHCTRLRLCGSRCASPARTNTGTAECPRQTATLGSTCCRLPACVRTLHSRLCNTVRRRRRPHLRAGDGGGGGRQRAQAVRTIHATPAHDVTFMLLSSAGPSMGRTNKPCRSP